MNPVDETSGDDMLPPEEPIETVPPVTDDAALAAPVESTPEPSAPSVTDADPSDEADEEPAAEFHDPRVQGQNEHSDLSKATFRPLKPGQKVDLENSVALLDATIDEFNALVESYPNIDLTQDQLGSKWGEVIKAARRHIQVGNAFISSLYRDDSLWRQSVTSGAEQLAPSRPRLGDSGNPENRLTGVHAMMKIQAVLGMGAVMRIPLFHSGLWVSIKAPSEAALLELERRISNEKITLGRQSNGLIFSNSSIYTTMYLVEFVLAHVYEATYKYEDVSELKSIILISDIDMLLAGMLLAIYPQGYPFQKSCLTNPVKCQYVVEELLDISKLFMFDDRALTDKQRKHMSQRTAKFTLDQIKAYQTDHKFMSQGVVALSDELSMELKVPTIAQYEESGMRWVDDIVKHTDQAFAGTLTAQERDTYILEQGAMTAFRQYAHWIDRLVISGSEKIDDRKSIEESISLLTANDDVFKTYFEGMQKFIDGSTIALTAIPRFNCPSCGAPMSDEDRRHPHLIPINMSNLFFTILGQRIVKVLSK